MAVDSKLTETNGTATTTLVDLRTAPIAQGSQRLKRSSSLMRSAAALPKVEHSLDEFIARANQTLVDVSSWDAAEQQAKADDEKRRELDAQRWKQAEAQMRESEVREQQLRRQLDGLQGKLAEAEARVAVALSSASQAMPAINDKAQEAQETAIEQLRAEIEKAQHQIAASEEKSRVLAVQLERARTQAPAIPVTVEATDVEVEERILAAEAKAAKALAAARAAAAGLTVSSADLAAIESGLVVPPARRASVPWVPILGAFAGGLALMFVVWKVALDKPGASTPAATATVVDTAPVATPAPAPVQTTVPAAAAAAPVAAAAPTVTPIDEPSKPTVTPIEDEPVAVNTPEPKRTAPAVRRPAPAARAATTPPAPAAKKPAIEDPFAAPAAKPAPAKKPDKGGIVDPFAGG